VPIEHGAGYTLLPANQDLTAAEVRLLTLPIGRETKLRQALAPKRNDFDLVLIDCPPALNMLTVNALVAADSVLIPMQCEYYALEGLTALLSTVEQIRVAANPQLVVEGVLRTMFDPRNNLANEVSAQLITHFGDKVFRTVIPRNIRLAEAPSFGKPALFHDRESRGALAYLALAGEMIRREEDAQQLAAAQVVSAAAAPDAATAPDATAAPSVAAGSDVAAVTDAAAVSDVAGAAAEPTTAEAPAHDPAPVQDYAAPHDAALTHDPPIPSASGGADDDADSGAGNGAGFEGTAHDAAAEDLPLGRAVGEEISR